MITGLIILIIVFMMVAFMGGVILSSRFILDEKDYTMIAEEIAHYKFETPERYEIEVDLRGGCKFIMIIDYSYQCKYDEGDYFTPPEYDEWGHRYKVVSYYLLDEDEAVLDDDFDLDVLNDYLKMEGIKLEWM